MNRRIRLNSAHYDAPRPMELPRPSGASASRSAGCQRALGLVIFVSFTLTMAIWLLWSQIQIGRVLLVGVPADGTIVAVNQCSRATAGNVTIVFTDARDETRQVRHTNFTPGCWNLYHVGEAVAVRYVPSDPSVLMTQPEMGDLWLSLIIFGMCDVLFVGGGSIISFGLILPSAFSKVSALLTKWQR